jgi:hypothetical protein
MRHWKRFALISLLLSVAHLGAACHTDGSDSDGGHTGDGGNNGSLTIMPPGGTLTVTDLAALPSLTLSAIYTAVDGSSQSVPASWTLDRYDIGQVGGSSGVLTAVGNAFGTVKVTATAMGLTATADVLVKLQLVVNDANVSPGAQSTLDGASTTDPMVGGLQYPYDKTIFPRALLAPELMWKGGVDSDLYSLHFVAPSCRP